jgi:hypothetical protein
MSYNLAVVNGQLALAVTASEKPDLERFSANFRGGLQRILSDARVSTAMTRARERFSHNFTRKEGFEDQYSVASLVIDGSGEDDADARLSQFLGFFGLSREELYDAYDHSFTQTNFYSVDENQMQVVHPEVLEANQRLRDLGYLD